MIRTVNARQGDTLDEIASRYYGANSVPMLPALIEANPYLVQVFIPEHTAVQLPAPVQLKQSQTLKLWD